MSVRVKTKLTDRKFFRYTNRSHNEYELILESNLNTQMREKTWLK